MTKFLLIISLFLTVALAAEQTAFAQNEHIAVKTDGRFIAHIESYGDDVADKSNDFLEKIEMYIQWWGLLGQPVYSYGFKWVPSGKYSLPGGQTISRAQLSKYPELQARFDDMNPSQIEIAFDIKVTPRSTGGTLTGSTDRLKTPNYYTGGGTLSFATAKGTVTTSSFLTGRPNQMMQDMSPGSPRDWKSFVDWEYAEDENVSAQNTFQDAQSIEFLNLRITKITPPDVAARTLLQAFNLREKKDTDGNMWSDKPDEKLPKPENTKAAKPAGNMWSDQNTSETKQAAGGLWSDRTDGSAIKKQSSKNMWSDAPPETSASTSGNMWSDTNTASIFKIETRGGKMGVIGSAGQILIPFNDWKIIKYNKGLAQVQKTEYLNGSCNDEYAYSITVTTTGLVGKSGQWIGVPKTSATGDTNQKNYGMVIMSYSSSSSPAERDASDRRYDARVRADRNQCESILQSKLSRY